MLDVHRQAGNATGAAVQVVHGDALRIHPPRIPGRGDASLLLQGFEFLDDASQLRGQLAPGDETPTFSAGRRSAPGGGGELRAGCDLARHSDFLCCSTPS